MPLALGTDTAGSGRVPAGFNNIVGLKPSVGLVSTHGVVPACRTLDCVSVFALTVDDAFAALERMAGSDPADPFSRPAFGRAAERDAARPAARRAAAGQRDILRRSSGSAAAYNAALARLGRLGAAIVEIDIEPFYETARLLYDGPWLAERYIAARALIASSPESLHPVTREIILGGARPSAVDAFAAFYRLAELRRVRDHIFRRHRRHGVADRRRLSTPSAKSLADPIALNSRLGTYTNFVNLLELCAIRGSRRHRAPMVRRSASPCWRRAEQDALLAAIGRVFHAPRTCRSARLEAKTAAADAAATRSGR